MTRPKGAAASPAPLSEIPCDDLIPLFEDAPIIFGLATAPDLRLIYLNRTLRDLLMRADAVGRTLIEALPELEEQGYLELIREAHDTGRPVARRSHPLILRPHPATEELRYVDFVIQPIKNAEGAIVALMCTGYDVTNEQHASSEAARLTEELYETRRSVLVEGLAASVAHELKQPLSASSNYLGAADALLQDSQVSKAREMIAAAEGQVRRASDIINGLRALSGARLARREVVDIRHLVQEVTSSVTASGACPRIGIRLEWEGQDLNVSCDPGQIFKVLGNLIRNACRAMSGRGGEVRIAAALVGHDMVEITVEDEGPGFSEEMIKLGPRMGKSTTGGLGIGLALSEALVQAHGGHLFLGNGARGGRVVFTVPKAAG